MPKYEKIYPKLQDFIQTLFVMLVTFCKSGEGVTIQAVLQDENKLLPGIFRRQGYELLHYTVHYVILYFLVKGNYYLCHVQCKE